MEEEKGEEGGLCPGSGLPGRGGMCASGIEDIVLTGEDLSQRGQDIRENISSDTGEGEWGEH